MKQTLATIVLVASAIVSVLGVPSASFAAWVTDPCRLATIGGMATVLLLLGTALAGPRAARLERTALALFLGGMPLVYAASWFAAPVRESTAHLVIELAAAPVFGALAAAGLRRPWLLAAGIAAHGALWDAWHIGLAGVVPPWYATGCLIVDLGIAIYVAARLPVLARGINTPRQDIAGPIPS